MDERRALPWNTAPAGPGIRPDPARRRAIREPLDGRSISGRRLRAGRDGFQYLCLAQGLDPVQEPLRKWIGGQQLARRALVQAPDHVRHLAPVDELLQQYQVDGKKLHQPGARDMTGHDVAVEVQYRDFRIDFEGLSVQLKLAW